MIVEICCTSVASFRNAVSGGAHRLELCENLSQDGLTPSTNFLEQVMETSPIPVHVLIRPRGGNFTYSELEIQAIGNQIEKVKSYGAQGIVMGALNPDQGLAVGALQGWIQKAKGMDLTFHRAFDRVAAPEIALKTLIDLGFNRILTSGQQKTAVGGIELLKELQSIAKEHLTIMPGGGINDQNCELFFEAGFGEIHLSAKGKEKTANGENISDLSTIGRVVEKSKKYY